MPAPLVVTNGKFIDVSNETINGITFLYPCERRNKRLLWLCKCYCGNHFKAESKSIKNGNTKSCGCLFLHRLREYNTRNSEDLLGRFFGKLEVIEKTTIQHNRQHWLCKCECGNLHETDTDSLLQGKIHSCGCLKSYAEYQLKKHFEEYHINYIPQYSFQDCRSVRGYLLYFDFAIIQNGKVVGLIEYQGKQHYDSNNGWYKEAQIENDHIKIKYCEEKNIPLLHLYNDYKIDEVIGVIRGWSGQ